MLVHENCTELIRQLNQIQWKEDSDNMARETSSGSAKPFVHDDSNTDWDLIDAFRYGVFSYLKAGNVDISCIGDGIGILDMSDYDFEEETDTSMDYQMAQQGMFRVSTYSDEYSD